MSRVLVIQNTRIEGSGYLGEILHRDGFSVDSVHAKYERIPDEPYSLVVILGAPESANSQSAYLHEEQKRIRRWVDKNVPVLGICLGSQLIAKTFGASVYAGPKKEIGFYDDLRTDLDSRLFSGFEEPFTVFHWHGDTFDLPIGASCLAHSKEYQNQAFQIHSAVGLQFHLEVNEKMINLWLDRSAEMLEKIPHVDAAEIRLQIHEKIPTVNANMDKFYKNFKSAFGI